MEKVRIHSCNNSLSDFLEFVFHRGILKVTFTGTVVKNFLLASNDFNLVNAVRQYVEDNHYFSHLKKSPSALIFGNLILELVGHKVLIYYNETCNDIYFQKQKTVYDNNTEDFLVLWAIVKAKEDFDLQKRRNEIFLGLHQNVNNGLN